MMARRTNRRNKSDLVAMNHKRMKSQKKQLDEMVKNIKKLKNSVSTVQVKYPQYKESYDYVDNIFPDVGVKNIVLYKTSAKTMERLGFGHAGGFYDRMSKIIVFSTAKPKRTRQKNSVTAKLNQDEVIVHELCHLCYFSQGKSSVSVGINEEFAYGWSIGYLRSKGYSDDDIIKDNFMPFLYQQVREKVFWSILSREGITKREYSLSSKYQKQKVLRKYEKSLHKETLELATEKGHQIIKIYTDKLNSENNIGINKTEKSNGFSLLDLD
jgi:hypothetical protein